MTQRPEVARFNMTQRPEVARFMTQRPKAEQIKHYRRFHGYDYSRGASIFVTFAVKGRLPLFGRVEGDKVVLSPDPLKMVYRPHVEDTLAFAEGRLAVVSRECSPEMSRYDAWHGMNDAMVNMAAACGDGLGVYIHRKGAHGAAAPVWERR